MMMLTGLNPRKSAQEAPHPAAAPEVPLDEQEVRRVGHGIEVQVLDTRAHSPARAAARARLPILDIGSAMTGIDALLKRYALYGSDALFSRV
jgi:hypothetical protein